MPILENNIILGIDPGYDRLGVAVITRRNGYEELLHSDCLTSDRQQLFAKRLAELGANLENIIQTYQPTTLAIEKLFFTKNHKTAMTVSEIRGVIIYLAGKYDLKIFEYTPVEIKQTITGYGQADKKQVTMMVKNLITINKLVTHDDEFDAIAISLTALAREKFT